MGIEPIHRVSIVSFDHQTVACHLGNDAGCHDTRAQRSAFDNSPLSNSAAGLLISVDEYETRTNRELLDAFAHGVQCRAQNIQRINDLVRHYRNGGGDGFLHYLFEKIFALVFSEGFAVRKSANLWV